MHRHLRVYGVPDNWIPEKGKSPWQPVFEVVVLPKLSRLVKIETCSDTCACNYAGPEASVGVVSHLNL
ncbi:hypothetical protein TNCV_2744571 [Trichonephila clavipes]|nr:hypothetical protein TNCV_2744571 [Trichonephila clavipes]